MAAGLLVPLIVGAVGTVALVASVGLQLDGASTSALEVGRRALLGCALALPTAALAFLVTPRSRGPAAQ